MKPHTTDGCSLSSGNSLNVPGKADAVIARTNAWFSPPARCNSDAALDSGSAPGSIDASETYPLVVIAGPTAAGKSALALHLAEKLNGEIVNYDSIQLFRGLDIGSGKAGRVERERIPHHLLDVLDPGQIVSAGHYRRLAIEALAGIKRRGSLPVLAGGTGLYLRALLEGLFEGPARSESVRARLRQLGARRGCDFVHRILHRLDRAAAARIHPHDTSKVIRAIEVRFLSGEPISALHRRGRARLKGFGVTKIGLNPDRAELYSRINRRVEGMFAAGLVEETRSILAGMGKLRPEGAGPLGALGYRQACAVLRGDLNLAEAVAEAQVVTRRYAKRQITWLRREPSVTWFGGFGDDPDLRLQVLRHLSHRRSLRLEPVSEPAYQPGHLDSAQEAHS